MRKKKILVVDDEDGIRDFLRTFLEDRDYDVCTAENGEMGLQILQKEQPDLLIVDLKMPSMGGINMLQEIQKTKISIEVIVLTAMDDMQSRRDAEKLGIEDYILKPLDLAHLEEVITRKFHSADS